MEYQDSNANQQEEQLTEGAKEALKEELKDFLRELTKFTLWSLALTFVVLSSRNSAQMHSASLLLRSTFNLDDGAQDGPSSSGDGFWPYITDATSKINQDDYFSEERPPSKYRKLRGTTVLGNRLRQVRSVGDACPPFYDSVQKASPVQVPAPCFGEAGVLSSSNSFTKEWQKSFMSDLEASGAAYADAVKAAFQFSDNKNEQFFTVGEFETYPAGGFIANIPLAEADSTQMFEQLQELHWIDAATRAVVWDLLMYNPNTDYFQNLRVLFEFSPSGIMAYTSSVSVHNLNLYPMKTFPDYINVGLQGFVVLMLLYYTKEESQEIWSQGWRKYFVSIWNVFDVINIILLIVLAIMRITTFSTATSFLAAFPTVDFGTGMYLMQAMTQQTYILGVALNLMWVKMLKYLTRHKAFSKLGRTIAMAAPTLAALTVFFLITILGYSIAYLLIIGVDNYEYATLTSSIWAIMRSLMGDYAYSSVAQANPVLGPLLYWSWQVLCQVIFLNLIIAAFCEDFAKILMVDNASKEKTMFDVLGEFDVFKRAQELLGKRDALQELEEKLDFLDVDDDGLVDEEELRIFLSANKDAAAMFQVDDAAVLVKMFDKDGSGKLDVEEMVSLRQYLADKKAKVDMAIASAVNGDRSQLESLMQGDAFGAAMNMQINRPGKIGADASRLLGVDAESLSNMKAGLEGDQSAAALDLYEGNVKKQQVEALQAKVEALSKKIASLLQLLPGLGERFGVSMQQMSDHVSSASQQ